MEIATGIAPHDSAMEIATGIAQVPENDWKIVHVEIDIGENGENSAPENWQMTGE